MGMDAVSIKEVRIGPFVIDSQERWESILIVLLYLVVGITADHSLGPIGKGQ